MARVFHEGVQSTLDPFFHKDLAGLRSTLQRCSLHTILDCCKWGQASDTLGADDSLVTPLKMSPIQMAYYNGGQIDGTDCCFYMERDFKGGSEEVERLERCIRILIRRHPALRLRVLAEGEFQEILPERQFDDWKLPCEDLRADFNVEKSLEYMTHQSTSDRLWDVRVAILPGEVRAFRLFLRLNLIALDAGSILRLCQEMDSLYGDDQCPTVLDHFGSAMREHCRVLSNSTDFKSIETYPKAPKLPKMPSAADVVINFERIWGNLNSKAWCDFQSMCKEQNLTATASIICCFQDVLRNHVGKSKDFTLNITSTKRMHVADALEIDAADLVGDFTNCHLLACRSGPVTFLDRARAIQEQLLSAPSLCGIQLQREMRRRLGDESILFDVVVTSLLAYKSWKPTHLPLTGTCHVTTQTPQVVLDLQFFESSMKELCLSFDAATHIIPQSFVEEIMRELEHHLREVVAEHFEGEILAPNPREVCGSAIQEPLGSLDDAVLRSIRIHQEETAVVDAATGKSLSYHELGGLASFYAQKIQSEGSQELVSVVMQKGWEQVVAVGNSEESCGFLSKTCVWRLENRTHEI